MKKVAGLGWHHSICIDYRTLNKLTKKDAYPLPLPDEVDRLPGATVFSKLDLHSGYWQMPVHPDHNEKTAFCPGPGMGLFQFCRIPFGLAGAPSSFQCMMDNVLRGLPFIVNCIDDILVHSANKDEHTLFEVFQQLKTADLALCGKKCQERSQTHTKSRWFRTGQSPKAQQLFENFWCTIAAPLHALTQKKCLLIGQQHVQRLSLP